MLWMLCLVNSESKKKKNNNNLYIISNIKYHLVYYMYKYKQRYKCLTRYNWIKSLTRLTRRVPLVEQELPSPPEHPSSLAIFSGVRITRSLVVCVCFVDRCPFVLFLLPIVLSVLIRCAIFWLPLWYLQTLLFKLGKFWYNIFVLLKICIEKIDSQG